MALILSASAQRCTDLPVRLMKTAMVSILLRGLGPLSAFILTLLLARSLGASTTGAFYLTTTVMTCCAIVAKLGFDNALQRFAGGAAQRGDWATARGVYHQACRITGCIGVLVAALFLASSSPLSVWLLGGEHQVLLALIALAVLPFAWMGVQAAMLKAIGYPALGGFIEVGILPLLTFALVGVSALNAPLSISMIALCYLGAAIASALLGTWLVHRHLPANRDATPVDHQRLLDSCLPLTLVELLNYVILWSPLLLLGTLANTSDAGLYNVAHRLAAQLGLIALVFGSISAPRFAACHQTNNLDELRNLAIRHTRMMTMFGLPPTVVLLFGAEPILSLFGHEFVQAGNLLVILMVGQMINIATGPVGYLLSMSSHERVLRNLAMLITPITIVLAVSLIPTYGALGAAWSVCLSTTLQNLICCWLVKQKLDLPFLLLLAPARARSKE